MLSRTVLTLSFVAFSTSVILAASTTEQGRATRMRFEAMDRNSDGVITRDEWQGSARSFQVHDWNGDGRLAGNEVRVGGQREEEVEGADHAPGRAERYAVWTAAGFTRLDHDRDGRLTVNEWHYDMETFRRIDRNGDEAVSRNEFLTDEDAEDDDRGDNFDDLDMNNNGRVERAEWHAGAAAFTRLDKNGDGVLSRFEVVGAQTSQDTYDQFAGIDYDRSGTIARDEWHWSNTSFNQRDTNGDGTLSRREFDAAGGAPLTAAAASTVQSVRVNAQQRWTDSAITVRAGDTLTFEANGSITMSDDSGDTASPAGSSRGRRAPDAPVLNQLAGGLIIRIDDYGPIFVGGKTTLVAPVGGRVYLGVNDDHLPDNRGEFIVKMGVRGRTSR